MFLNYGLVKRLRLYWKGNKLHVDEMINNMKNNMAVIGLPRAGKSVLTKRFFDEFRDDGLALYINTQWELYFKGYRILKTLEEFNDVSENKIVFNFENNEQLIPLVNKLFDTQKLSPNPRPIRIIIDEVYQFQELDGARKTLTKLVVDGLKWNIQTVITAHFPQMVYSSIYKNCHIFVFFRLNPMLYDFFKRTWRINLFPLKDYLAIPYNYIVYDNDFYLKDGTKISLDNYKDTRQIQIKKKKPNWEDGMTISEILKKSKQV